MPSVLWHCWLGGKKGIRPVKNWAVGCWHGYLSGARSRLAYGSVCVCWYYQFIVLVQKSYPNYHMPMVAHSQNSDIEITLQGVTATQMKFLGWCLQLPSVLWHCWLGIRKSIRPVKIQWWNAGLLVWLSVWSEVQTVCIWSSWCSNSAIPKPSHLLPHLNPDWFYIPGKVKVKVEVRKTPHRYGNSRAIWDHTVLPATRQRWHSRLYPSRSWYSIKRPRRDARLSWPSWLITGRDGIPARRRSPIPVVTGPDMR